MSGIAAFWPFSDNLVIARRVPAGASIPHHVLMSTSSAAGFGDRRQLWHHRRALRAGDANAFNLLARCGEAAETARNARSTRPPSRSAIAGVSPLYATYHLTLATYEHPLARCGGAPAPYDA
jgi:hypothetical protein